MSDDADKEAQEIADAIADKVGSEIQVTSVWCPQTRTYYSIRRWLDVVREEAAKPAVGDMTFEYKDSLPRSSPGEVMKFFRDWGNAIRSSQGATREGAIPPHFEGPIPSEPIPKINKTIVLPTHPVGPIKALDPVRDEATISSDHDLAVGWNTFYVNLCEKNGIVPDKNIRFTQGRWDLVKSKSFLRWAYITCLKHACRKISERETLLHDVELPKMSNSIFTGVASLSTWLMCPDPRILKGRAVTPSWGLDRRWINPCYTNAFPNDSIRDDLGDLIYRMQADPHSPIIKVAQKVNLVRAVINVYDYGPPSGTTPLDSEPSHPVYAKSILSWYEEMCLHLTEDGIFGVDKLVARTNHLVDNLKRSLMYNTGFPMGPEEFMLCLEADKD